MHIIPLLTCFLSLFTRFPFNVNATRSEMHTCRHLHKWQAISLLRLFNTYSTCIWGRMHQHLRLKNQYKPLSASGPQNFKEPQSLDLYAMEQRNAQMSHRLLHFFPYIWMGLCLLKVKANIHLTTTEWEFVFYFTFPVTLWCFQFFSLHVIQLRELMWTSEWSKKC